MAKLWKRAVLGGDNDSQAVEVAVENAKLNGVAALCRFVTSIGLQVPELATRAPYDLIVANILAGPLMELSESFAAAMRPGGRVLLSGLLVEQADMIVSTYKRRGFEPERQIDLETGGAWWRTLLLQRTS
jgi:ribosomal protein L11 methyltransferase